MKNRKKVTTAFLMLTALGMGLASCGGPNENSSSSSEGSSDNSTSEVTSGSSSEVSSESPSSSSIAAAKHKVEAVSTEEVEIKVDAAEAKEGDTITITIRVLNENKVLSEVLVNGKKDGVTAATEGSKYTYVMSDEDIKVTAVLADRVYEGHSITINEIEGFSVSFKTENKAESKTLSAKKGELVTVIVKVTSDTLRFKELTSNDVTLSISKNEGQHIEETFTMPDQNVTLNLVSEAIPTHALSVIASKGMSVSFFYNNQEVTEGIEGKQIQIKIALQEKYVFGKIESMNEDLTLTTVKEGEEYSFIMPSEDASFVATCSQVINKYALTDIQTCGGVTITSGIQKGEQIDEGETVTFSFSYKNEKDGNYALSYGAYINNDLVMATIDSNTKTGTISFVMPSKDATIYVGPFNEPLAAATDTTSQVALPALNDNFKIFGIKNGYYDQGDSNTYRSMKLYLLAKKEFVVSRFSYSNGYSDTTIQSNSDGSYTFYFYNVRGKDTTLKVDGSIKEMRTISFTDIDKIDIEGDYSAMPEGSKVSLVIKPKSGYELKNNSSPRYIVKSYQYGDKTDTGMTWDWDSSKNTLSFTMPNANLTITLNIVETVALSVANPEALSSYKFTDDEFFSQKEVTSITGGSSVRFYPVAKDGERITNVYLNDSTTPLPSKTSSGKTYYTFTAPDTGTAVLRIETATLHSFTAESSDAYTVSSVSSISNVEGEEVSFKLVRKIGYKITKVSLSNGDELFLKAGTNDTYTFAMPAENVSLNVETEEVTTVTLTVGDEKPFYNNTCTISDAYGSSVKSGSVVNSNEKFTISFANKNGFSVTGIALSEGTATKENDTKYSFTTPSSDLTITPIYEESEKHTITIDNENTDQYTIGTVTDNYYSVSTSEAIYGYVGHKMKVRVDSKNNSSKLRYFDNAKVINVATNEEVALDSSSVTQDDDEISLVFTMPSADVKITFDIVEKQSRQINKGQNADMFKVVNKSWNGEEIASFVKGTTLYVQLNATAYQWAYYNKSFTIRYSYVENGETKTGTCSSFYSKNGTAQVLVAPDADVIFDLIVTEPTEKVTIAKEDTDKKDQLVIADDTSNDFGDSFVFGKGKQLCAKIKDAVSDDFTNGKYTITIKDADTGDVINTKNFTSNYNLVVYFYANSNITVSLTYTQGN